LHLNPTSLQVTWSLLKKKKNAKATCFFGQEHLLSECGVKPHFTAFNKKNLTHQVKTLNMMKIKTL
jgi:hypothetical protein